MEITEEELAAKIKAAVEAETEGLKRKRDELLAAERKNKEALARTEQEKADAIEAQRQEQLAKDGKTEELIAAIQKQAKERVDKLQQDLDASTAAAQKSSESLRVLLVDKGLSSSFLDAGVTDKNLLEAAVALHAGKAEIVYGEDGTPSVNVAGKPMKDYIEGWAEGPGKAFITAGNSGGGAGGNAGGAGVDDYEVYFKQGTINLTKQMELKRTDPVRYENLAKQYANKGGRAPLNNVVR